jgi:outer membrane lipoprotein SlyB
MNSGFKVGTSDKANRYMSLDARRLRKQAYWCEFRVQGCFLRSVAGGFVGGAVVGGELGGVGANPGTVAGGAIVGGIAGGIVGYNLFCGAYEELRDFLC